MQFVHTLVSATALAVATSALVAGGSAASTSAAPEPTLSPEPTSSAAAAAKSGSVKIKKLRTARAPYRGKAKVKPKYAVKGKAVADKATLTVKRRGKVITRNKKSAKLAPGTYRVTQRVTYRPYSMVNKPVVRHARGTFLDAYDFYGEYECEVLNLHVGQQIDLACTIYDYDDYEQEFVWDLTLSLTYDHARDAWFYGDRKVADAYGEYDEWDFYPDVLPITRDLTYNKKVRSYGKTRTAKKTQKLTIKPGAKPRTCATYADFKKIEADFSEPEEYGHSKSQVAKILNSKGKRTSFSDYGSYVIEFRDYKPCDARASISVGFFAGYAYSKSYSG